MVISLLLLLPQMMNLYNAPLGRLEERKALRRLFEAMQV